MRILIRRTLMLITYNEMFERTVVMDHRVEKVMALMQARLDQRLIVSDLARAVNLSSAHLRQLFTTETGASPMQYLKELRMQQAKELLRTTFLSVKEVMAQVGVSDKIHFVRDFKRAYGLTPAQYRESYGQAHHTTDERPKRNPRIG